MDFLLDSTYSVRKSIVIFKLIVIVVWRFVWDKIPCSIFLKLNLNVTPYIFTQNLPLVKATTQRTCYVSYVFQEAQLDFISETNSSEIPLHAHARRSKPYFDCETRWLYGAGGKGARNRLIIKLRTNIGKVLRRSCHEHKHTRLVQSVGKATDVEVYIYNIYIYIFVYICTCIYICIHIHQEYGVRAGRGQARCKALICNQVVALVWHCSKYEGDSVVYHWATTIIAAATLVLSHQVPSG